MKILETYAHYETICVGAQLRKLSVTRVVFGVRGVVKGMGKFQEIDICTNFTAYNEPNTVEAYILLFFKALSFCESFETSLVPSNQLRENSFLLMVSPNKGISLNGIYILEGDLTTPCYMIGIML